MPEYGCYCMAMGASAPGIGPTKFQRLCQCILESQIFSPTIQEEV